MSFQKTTEQDSGYQDIDQLPIIEVLSTINKEDKTVADSVAKVLPAIEKLVLAIVKRLKKKGRLFYIGAGTSGRLGIVDASECPPTFGVDHGLVVGLIAGGDKAIRKAVEFAEDSQTQGWKDLVAHGVSNKDVVIGIAASGTTPYVVHALENCQANNIITACITCNENSPVTKYADHPIEVIVGPEVLSGSTRMKAGTAQKMILNLISTTVMIKLGRVKGNKMTFMQLSNSKLIDRGVQMLCGQLNIPPKKAQELLEKYKSVHSAIEHYQNP